MEITKQFYRGDDLGAVYKKSKTEFRLWAPTAEKVAVRFFHSGDGDTMLDTKDMVSHPDGTWTYVKEGDCHKLYYTYLITVNGVTGESTDPYGRATGVNGVRSMVVDLRATDPEGFHKDRGPVVEKETDIIVYELSVRDTTADASCGVKYPGKYLGLTECGTRNSMGKPTGLDHIADLGVTHVQLMPCYDFGSVDESRTDDKQYNWGYDPINYNVPEGSYATDPFHGEVRIKEMKQMIQAFHQRGLGVIMDVVYNHTYDIENNCFQKCVPDYYYRKTEDGYSDASACGNEVATEKPMVTKYILDSLLYWMREYHVDGFRFDLMGCMDIQAMEMIAGELKKENPSVILYGEGWTGGPSVLPDEERCLKANVPLFHGIGAFSDDIRDTIKGHVFRPTEPGFVSGKKGMENDVRYSVVGAVYHPQVDYQAYGYSDGPWAKNPTDTINYVSCHDNLTLWDKFTISRPDSSEEEKLDMNKLAAAVYFTSQGVPFLLSGEEFARTKPLEGEEGVAENSYNLSLYTNSLKYDNLDKYQELVSYYKGLIALRKRRKGFRLKTAEEVRKAVDFVYDLPANAVGFTVTTEEEILYVVYNANKEQIRISLPEEGDWQVYMKDKKISDAPLMTVNAQKKETMSGISCFIAVKNVRNNCR